MPEPLRILSLSSPLTPSTAVSAVTDGIATRLARAGVTHRFVTAGEGPFDALLIVSGGTEHLALTALESADGPAILLAHPERNSLPAALEIVSALRLRGRPARIVMVGEATAGEASLGRLVRLLDVRRRLRATRFGRIGAPSEWLVASVPSAETVAATWGPTLVDVPIEEVVEAFNEADPTTEAAAIRERVVGGADSVREPSPANLDAAARVVGALRSVVRRHHLDACTVRCFDLVTGLSTTGCLALSWLLDEGMVAGCEGDVPATLTMLWLQLLTGEPAFMANPQALDPAANTLDLAHCTVARRLLSRYELRSHFESSLGVGIAGRFEPGPATLARIGGADLREAFVSAAEIVGSGMLEERCRTQVTVRLASPVTELLTRPLGNHHVLARGDWAAELREYHELLIART